ncbi:hypothetical protein RGQ29_027465 [Quercus rubra]|uniref:GRAM domain-containing protein n=1 Tax=Quercus rubra TaxID=3512 RepID=A0AAN7EPH8_QUERU|nr:hypothetical protein RGQ29_027465 [Quercus rubra]
MYNHSQSQVPPLTNNNHNQHTNNPYIIISPDPTSSYSSCKLRVSPSLTDAAMARLVQGTKVLAEGGLDHAFQQAFNILPGEELLNSYACYLSTTSGPVIGTLYLSTKRVAFCSDYSFCCYSSTGQPEWMYYKMVVQLDQLRAVNPSANRLNPSEKYIHIITRDGYEFWFMGFISYDKALKKLTEALQRACNSSGVVSRV